MYKLLIKTFIVLITSLFSLSVMSAESVYESRGFAIKGYDSVAYFTQDEAVKGEREFSHKYKGATWLFASAANLELFKAEPAKYAPQYNGYCAYAMGTSGDKVRVDPTAYTIKDDKLYLNYSHRISGKFNAKIDEYIEVGNTNWDKILAN